MYAPSNLLTMHGTAQAQKMKHPALLSLTIVLRIRHDAELSKHLVHFPALHLKIENEM